jgi:hypothetical protein
MKTSIIFTFSDLCSQGIELLGGRLARVPCGRQLPFPYGVHRFYAGDRTPGGPKGFEAEHGTRESFHCAMVLLHEVIEIFRVADDNRCLMSLVVVPDRGRVAATLIDGDLLGEPLGAYRFA